MVGGTTTISGIPRDFDAVAAAAACPIVDRALMQLCTSQSRGSSWLQSVCSPQCSPVVDFVHCHPNTGSLISSPLLSLDASVQYIFQGKGTSDCSQKYSSRGSSSKVTASTVLILSNVFNGSGSNTRQGVLAKSNQFIR